MGTYIGWDCRICEAKWQYIDTS